MRTKILTLLLATGSCLSFAQQAPKPYSLFRPVPQTDMREMATDRPDVTESTTTVDAGHFQAETDLAALERQTAEGMRKSTWMFNNMILKAGLTRSTDLQLGFETFVREVTVEAGQPKSTENGTGNLTLRIKQNLLGNDKGNFALAILPYVKFPVATYGEKHPYEGGVIVPMHYKFKGDWKIGGQLELDRLEDLDGQETHTEFLQSITLSHPLAKKLDGLAETYYTYDFKQHHFSNFVTAAVQLEVAKDLKIDGGVNYGIQKDAEKRYFVGLALRI